MKKLLIIALLIVGCEEKQSILTNELENDMLLVGKWILSEYQTCDDGNGCDCINNSIIKDDEYDTLTIYDNFTYKQQWSKEDSNYINHNGTWSTKKYSNIIDSLFLSHSYCDSSLNGICQDINQLYKTTSFGYKIQENLNTYKQDDFIMNLFWSDTCWVDIWIPDN